MAGERRSRRQPFTIRTGCGRRRMGAEGWEERPFGRGEARREGIVSQTLSVQISVCLCVLLLCWALFSGDGELAGRFRRWYQDQMARPAIAWEDLRWEEAAQTMARWASQAQALWEEDEEAALTGQGGWWLQEDPLDQGAPQGASLSRYLLASPAQYPVYGQVTCAYGWRYHPITGNPDFHNGMDIAAPLGSGIYTAFPGTVTDRGESAIYGNYIEVTHSNSLRTVYCHCQELLAPEGANLRAGERVATVGSTGISTGPHLHFEVLVNGTYFDPAPALGFA